MKKTLCHPEREKNRDDQLIRRRRYRGSFTDLVLLQEGKIRVHKIPSTPDDPSRAILQGLANLGVAQKLVHGSTVATNAVLERTGR